MSNPVIPPKPRWFGGVGCALMFALGIPAMLLLTCLSGWLYFRFQHARYAKELAAQEQRVRDAGEPLDGAELNAWYRIPEGQEDLTELYLSIFETMEREEPADKAGVPYVDPDTDADTIPLPGEPWEDIARSEVYLANFEETFKLLQQTLEREGSVRYSVDYREGFAVELPHCSKLRDLTRRCVLRTAVLCHRHDYQEATDTLIGTIKAAESLNNEPLMISQLVRIAMHGLINGAITFALSDEEFPAEQIERVRVALLRIDRDSAARVAVMGERVQAYQAIDGSFDQIKEVTDRDAKSFAGITDQPLRQLRPGDCALLLQLSTDAVEACTGTYPEQWNKQMAVAVSQEATLAEEAGKSPWQAAIITTLLLLGADPAFSACARGAAQHRCTLVQLAAELHRRERGDYPQRLEELVPSYLPTLPEDPYTGEPLRMKHEPGGRFIVYATGKDGSDDGGDIDTLPGDQPRDTGLSVPPLRAEPIVELE